MVKNITTFNDLIAEPSSEKIRLVEIQIGENLNNYTWTQHATYTNVYYTTYGTDTITLTTGGKSIIYKDLDRVKGNNVEFTKVSDPSLMNNPGDTRFSQSSTTLYLNVTGLGVTEPKEVEGLESYFTIRFASRGVTLETSPNGYRYYEPFLKSAPSVNMSSSDLFSGSSITGAGRFLFNNEDGLFTTLDDKYIWINHTIKALFGGEDLPYGEYHVVFTGNVYQTSWSRDTYAIDARSYYHELSRSIPEDTLTTAAWPNLIESAKGVAAPIGFGTFSERTAPIAVAIDESYGTDQVEFLCADHTVSSINGAWVDYDDGTGWLALTLDPTLSSANTYKVTDTATRGRIAVRFTAGGYVSDKTRVKVAFAGRVPAGTPADVVDKILTIYLGFSSSDLDSSFTTSAADTDMSIALYLNKPVKVMDVINKILLSDLARFFIDGSGKFHYVTWQPQSSTSYSLDDTDLLSLEIDHPADEHYSRIKVGNQQSGDDQNYLYETYTDDISRYLYDVERQKLVNTYLDNESNAQLLAQRLGLLHRPPLVRVTGRVKWVMAEVQIGDRVSISTAYAPDSTGKGWTGKIIEIYDVRRDFTENETTFVGYTIDSIGSNIGFWTDATAPDWSVATDTDKASSGYWSDANGYADPSDGSSLNVSLWW